MARYRCSICGYIYDEAKGIPERGFVLGTKWKSLPDNFTCPICAAPKSVFKPIEETSVSPIPITDDSHFEKVQELSAGEISAICSSLAKGCEKQRLSAEMDAFNQIADYFKSKVNTEKDSTWSAMAKMLEEDLTKGFPSANAAAKANHDRGALRSLVWSEKVSMMTKSLLERFTKEGEAILENLKIYVCDICGFIYIGEMPPEICPVCKVPSYKILPVERS